MRKRRLATQRQAYVMAALEKAVVDLETVQKTVRTTMAEFGLDG